MIKHFVYLVCKFVWITCSHKLLGNIYIKFYVNISCDLYISFGVYFTCFCISIITYDDNQVIIEFTNTSKYILIQFKFHLHSAEQLLFDNHLQVCFQPYLSVLHDKSHGDTVAICTSKIIIVLITNSLKSKCF